MRLHIGKNYGGKIAAVQSIFRLAGNDEDALTYALGYLMAYDPRLCTSLLKLFGVAKPNALDSSYSVHLQEVTDRKQKFGRRDIVVDAGYTRIVVEAKIGSATPTANQLLKYAAQDELWNQYKTRRIVALTQVKLPAETEDHVRVDLATRGIQFSAVQWYEVLRSVMDYRPADGSEVSRYLFDEFIHYIRGDYGMGYFDVEISIQDVNAQNAKVFNEGWLYVTAPKDKKAPLYFAPYFAGQGANSGISMISRVLWVEQVKLSDKIDVSQVGDDLHLARWRKGLYLIRQRPDYHTFADLDTRLLYLDKPIVLWEQSLTKSAVRTAYLKDSTVKQIPQQIPKSFSLQFDELLRHKRLADN